MVATPKPWEIDPTKVTATVYDHNDGVYVRSARATRARRPLEIIFAVFLGSSALIKIISLFRGDAVLRASEPLFAIKYSYVFLASAIFEMLVIAAILLVASTTSKMIVIWTFIFCISSYRIVKFLGGNMFLLCPCLGTGFTWWPGFNRHLEAISLAGYIVALVLAGSIQLLRVLEETTDRKKGKI